MDKLITLQRIYIYIYWTEVCGTNIGVAYMGSLAKRLGWIS